jgi:hypothetical protein
MTITGGCMCGAIRYTIDGEPKHNALCWCADCRRASGTPMTGWALFRQDQVAITGAPVSYNSSGDNVRQFCGRCGTGLFFYSASIFPEQVDVQTGSFDNPDDLTPQAMIQVADAPAWRGSMKDMPEFARFPGM